MSEYDGWKYAVEYAKSARSKCKKCKEALEKDQLRCGSIGMFQDRAAPSWSLALLVALLVTGPPQPWHHLSCWPIPQKLIDVNAIKGFAGISAEDQQAVIDKLQATGKGGLTLEHNGEPDAAPAPTAADIPFIDFCALCHSVEVESGQLNKTSLIRTVLEPLSSAQAVTYLRLMLPKQDLRTYSMQDKGLCNLLAKIYNASAADVLSHSDQNGDVSDTAKHFFSAWVPQGGAKAALTLEDAEQLLQQLSLVGDNSNQQRLLSEWLHRCRHGEEVQYMVRLVKKDLKMSAGNKVVLEALSADAYEAFQCKSDLAAVVHKIKSGGGQAGGLKRSTSTLIKVGQGVKPMLAAQCKSAAAALKKCPRGMICEIKYDGERIQVQVHKSGDTFKYFSRSGKPVMKHKVENIEKFLPEACPHGHTMVIMVDTNTGELLPFGSLGKHKKEGYKHAQECLFVFDILLFNDTCLLNTPLHERRKFLEQNLVPIKNKVMLSEKFDVTDEGGLNFLLSKVLAENHEGLMIKDKNGVYEPDKRRWLKIKKDYIAGGATADTADLVVLGAYYGSGNKGGLMSVFLMGSYDPETKQWKTVCKVGNGHDDKAIQELTNTLPVKEVSKNMADMPSWLRVEKLHAPDFVVLEPQDSPVWEITGNEFVADGKHTAGYSIRFPRVTRVRTDKDWKTATDTTRLKALVDASKSVSQASYEQQLNKTSTSKYTGSQPQPSPAGAAAEGPSSKTKGVQSTLSFAPKPKPAAGTQTKLSFGVKPQAAAKPKAEVLKSPGALKRVDPQKNRQMIAAKGGAKAVSVTMDCGSDSEGTDLVDTSDDELEVVGAPDCDWKDLHRDQLIEFLQIVDAARIPKADQIMDAFASAEEMFVSLELQYPNAEEMLDKAEDAGAMDIDDPPSAAAAEDSLQAAKSLRQVLVEKAATKSAEMPVCSYGAGCYRKNPQHWLDYSHPPGAGGPGAGGEKRSRSAVDGDGKQPKKSKTVADDAEVDDAETDVSDSADDEFICGNESDDDDFKTESEGDEEDPIDDDSVPAAPAVVAKPICSYGTGCYRKNPQHFVDFDHPWKK